MSIKEPKVIYAEANSSDLSAEVNLFVYIFKFCKLLFESHVAESLQVQKYPIFYRNCVFYLMIMKFQLDLYWMLLDEDEIF